MASFKTDSIWRGATALLWVLLICAISLPLQASEDDEEPRITVRTVEGDTDQRDDERFASGMVTRISTDDLAFRGQNLSDAAGRVAGVYVRRDSSSGHSAYLSVRGGNPRQVAVELDGLRLSAPVGMGFDLGKISPEGFGSVDLYRGSAAAIYGSGAVTGAMRLNPRQAPEEGWEMGGRLSAGSFGTLGTGATAAVANDVAGLRLHAGFERSRGDFAFIDEQQTEHRRVNNDHQRISVGGTGHLLGETNNLRLTALWETGEAGSAGPSEFQEAFSHARVDDHRALAALRWQSERLISAENWEVDAHATAGVQQRAYRYLNDQGFMTRDRFEDRGLHRTAAATGGLTGFLGDSHLARIEGQVRVETYESVSQSLQQRQLEATRYTFGLAIADEWFLAQDRISLVAALRTEFIGHPSSQEARQGDDAIIRPLLPAAGVVGRVHRRLELRANLARTFRVADFDELYLDTESIRGNPNLDPEEAWTADVGLRLGHSSDPLVLQLGYFHNLIDSMILFLQVSPHLFEAQNLRGATSRGLEAAARLTLQDRWTLNSSYTYTRAYLRSDDVGPRPQLPQQPRHRLVMQSAVDLSGLSFWSDLEEVSLVQGANFRSSVYLDNFGNLKNDPALTLDVGAVVGLGSHLRAGAHLTNILDYRQAQDSLDRPLPGRAFFMSVEMKRGGIL